MKKNIPFTTLAFLLAFSSPSFAEWAYEGEHAFASWYLDFDLIEKKQGYVYYWMLINLLSGRCKDGHLSKKVHFKLDCNTMRKKKLTTYWYMEPDGKGPISYSHSTFEKNRLNHPFSSAEEYTRNKICDYVEKNL